MKYHYATFIISALNWFGSSIYAQKKKKTPKQPIPRGIFFGKFSSYAKVDIRRNNEKKKIPRDNCPSNRFNDDDDHVTSTVEATWRKINFPLSKQIFIYAGKLSLIPHTAWEYEWLHIGVVEFIYIYMIYCNNKR